MYSLKQDGITDETDFIGFERMASLLVYFVKMLKNTYVHSTHSVLCETFVPFVVKNLTTKTTKVSQRTLCVECTYVFFNIFTK